MREALFDLHAADATLPPAFEPGNLPVGTQSVPFDVIRVGGEAVDGTWQVRVPIVDVLCYGRPQANFAGAGGLDATVKKVVAALNYKNVTDDAGVKFVLVYTGSHGVDLRDTVYDALVRPVRFAAYQMSWLAATTYAIDPVAALQAWTSSVFGPTVGTDPATWTPSDASPGVYWRVDREVNAERTSWGAWYDVEIRGHVVVPTPTQRRIWVRRILERLAIETQVAMTDGSPLLLQKRDAADYEADPFRTGQISLQARFGVLASTLLAGDYVPPTSPTVLHHVTLEIPADGIAVTDSR